MRGRRQRGFGAARDEAHRDESIAIRLRSNFGRFEPRSVHFDGH
jgi:hypothetical protein